MPHANESSMIDSKLKTFLWFDSQAEEAANFYCSLLPDSSVDRITRYPAGAMGEEGSVMTVEFRLAGIPYVGLNGGPMFRFNEAISLAVSCEDQAEVDRLWEKLLEGGGQVQHCGWLKDRWGLSWQIVPKQLPQLLSSESPGVATRVTAAMLSMKKLDLAQLQRAAEES